MNTAENNPNILLQNSLYTTFIKQIYIYLAINNLTVSAKRHIYQLLRKSENLNTNIFMPQYGITAGEFAIFQKSNCGDIPPAFKQQK